MPYNKKKKKTPMPISEMKENLQALELFVSKYTDKNASFHYLLTYQRIPSRLQIQVEY